VLDLVTPGTVGHQSRCNSNGNEDFSDNLDQLAKLSWATDRVHDESRAERKWHVACVLLKHGNQGVN